jgi:transcriptional regulator with XRE-family HTH domain
MSTERVASDTRPVSVGLPGLRAAREAKFLTQIELAEQAGINPSTISELEVGRRKARFRTIRQLAAALAVTPEELVTPPRERAG